MNQPRKIKILIADSQPNYTVGLRKGLTDVGYDVYMAEDGDKALALVQEIQPDVILSEVKLPQLDGHDLLQAVRAQERTQHIPFMFISNQKRVEERIRSISLGVDDYIQKPYYVDEVIARIEMIIKEAHQLANAPDRGGFSGKLSEMNLVDLIQTLEMGQKSAILTLKRNGKQGEIQIHDGNVVDAHYEAFSAEEALDKMITWTEGHFQVKITTVNSSKQIKLDNKEIVARGQKQINQWHQLKTNLPPLSAVLVLSSRVDATALGKLNLAEKKLIHLMDGKRTLLDIIEQTSLEDLKVLEIIHPLFQKGFFKIKELRADNQNNQLLKAAKYLEHLKTLSKARRQAANLELSLVSKFFQQTQASEAPSFADFNESQPLQNERQPVIPPPRVPIGTKYVHQIHLTKSEIMMIREKLV